MKKIIALTLIAFSTNSFSFDLDDYAVTFRATRNAYLMQANSFNLSYSYLQNLTNLYKSSCYKINGADFANIAGLHSGACNEDGKSSYSGGGVARSGVSLGDNLAAIINITPMPVDIPDLKINDLDTLARTKRTEQYDAAEAAINITITRDLSCTPTTNYLGTAPTEALTELETRYQAVYLSYYRAAYAYQNATNLYKAAWEAYKTATSVYQAVSECENTMGTIDPKHYDPYNPY